MWPKNKKKKNKVTGEVFYEDQGRKESMFVSMDTNEKTE